MPGHLSNPFAADLGSVTPVIALAAPKVMPPLPNILMLSMLLTLDVLPLLGRVCLRALPRIELGCRVRGATIASPAPSMDADVRSVEDDDAGDIYLLLRGVLGNARFTDNFVVVSFFVNIRFVSGLTSLTGEDKSSSENSLMARCSFRSFLFGKSTMLL